MTTVRRGPLIAGTWLIGLGVVFLVRQAMGLDWSEAWPLFVILVGVASLVSTAVDRRPGVAGLWGFTWPVVWIVVGAVLLASTTGRLDRDPLDLVADGWPWAAVALGAWFILGAVLPAGAAPSETLAVLLDGATQADVRIRFGAGELSVGTAAAGQLVDGRFPGGVVQRRSGPGRIELEQDTTYGLPLLDNRAGWAVGLTGEVPLDLRLDTGASRVTLDLGGLRLRRLDLHTGASQVRVLLPRAAGATSVRAEAGAASLAFEVPSGVAARIRTKMALGSSQIDESRFPRRSDAYQSPDYEGAANRVDIDVQGGVGSLRVVGTD